MVKNEKAESIGSAFDFEWRRRLELNQTKAVLQTAALKTRSRRQFWLCYTEFNS
jgi:hypothetical protein